ncbi:hypothetical protein R1flu_000039 [Riccia fluitans]|uniref:Uncharacterized protein n=1 Tax=Riccia fluitans TaxID=41844 RepID=A0ABD1Y3G8_9MARC
MEYVSKDSQIPPGSNKDTMDEYIVLGSGESDTEEEVQLTRATTGVEENFVVEDLAKETFINLVDVEYGEDKTSGDEEGEHFEHATGGGSQVNELVRLQEGIPRSIPRTVHAESGMAGKENVVEDSNASGFCRRSKDTRSQVMVLYEEGLCKKVEYRKTFLDFRHRSLIERRNSDLVKLSAQIFLELHIEGKTIEEIEASLAFISKIGD